MAADRPDDADVPSDGARGRGRAGGTQVETRTRQEYHADLRAAVSAQESVAARRTAAGEQAAAEKWEKTEEESRWMWTEYQRKWPSAERPRADRPDDEPGSWRGDGGRYLDRAKNSRVDAECDQIAKREEEKISPALHAIESQDPDRHLIGFEHCRKGRDRIKEKIYEDIKFLKRSPEDAVSLVSDTIRFTFEYREARYTQGVWADIGCLKDQGFKLDKLKNSWCEEQYKGINTQWIEPDTGQRFEVQFHTRISFEAKQLTHRAYERLRTKQADALEELVLEAFQKKVTAEVPVPPGAAEIPDYP
ncbi:MAG: hypothetical protein ACRDOU_19365 [Streptosporangiaceae bacterium]